MPWFSFPKKPVNLPQDVLNARYDELRKRFDKMSEAVMEFANKASHVDDLAAVVPDPLPGQTVSGTYTNAQKAIRYELRDQQFDEKVRALKGQIATLDQMLRKAAAPIKNFKLAPTAAGTYVPPASAAAAAAAPAAGPSSILSFAGGAAKPAATTRARKSSASASDPSKPKSQRRRRASTAGARSASKPK
jgi:prefoldin subunit 5